jgi:hypothetical protein
MTCCRVRLPRNYFLANANALGGAVTLLRFRRFSVKLYKMGIIHIGSERFLSVRGAGSSGGSITIEAPPLPTRKEQTLRAASLVLLCFIAIASPAPAATAGVTRSKIAPSSNNPSVTGQALVVVLRGFGLSTLGANGMDQTHRGTHRGDR